jgi:hypothetical protein
MVSLYHAGNRTLPDRFDTRRLADLLGAPDDVRQLHARRLSGWLAELTEASLLLEQAAHELQANGSSRKAAVAGLYIREHLSAAAMRGISDDRSVLDLYDSVVRWAEG